MNDKISAADTVLGMDLGGTKLLIGEIACDGRVLRRKRYDSRIYKGASQEEILADACEAARSYMAGFDLLPGRDFSAIGMGLVGRVDPHQGVWLEIEPTRCVTTPVAAVLSESFKVPAFIDNDVRCGVSAEMLFGQGRGIDNFIYMNVGTGIGAGFVINGRKLTGAHFNGGEVGHTVADASSPVQCVCGRRGCVEALASGMGLDTRARALRDQFPETKLTFPEDSRVFAGDIFRLADEGDPLCRLLTDEAISALAETIMNLIWVSDPEIFIIGGGLISSGWMLDKVKEKLNPVTMRFLSGGLVITDLDSDLVGLIGAGALAFQGLSY